MKLKILLIEIRVLFEAIRISLRHPRYFTIFLALWSQVFIRPLKSRRSRWSYVLLQVIDDLLDGHRKSNEPPLQFVKEIKNQISFKNYSNDFWGSLVQEIMNLFDSDPDTWDARYEFLNIIDNMMLDHHRMREKKVWDESQLIQHHRETFIPSLNLLFMSLESKSRVNQVLELVDVMGWCSMIRDLDDDLSRGLINLPAHLKTESDRQDWLRQQAIKANHDVQVAEKKLNDLDAQAKKLGKMFIKSAKKYINQELAHD